MGKRRVRLQGASIFGDLERPRRWLEERRREGDRGGVAHWRQCLPVSAAAQRAASGNRTAASRLAWRKVVYEGRWYATWHVQRYKAYEAELGRIRREGPAAECPACARRQDRARHNWDYYLAEIAKLPRSVPTYAEYRRAPAEWPKPTTITPEVTLLEAGIDDARQAAYQRKMSMLLGRGAEEA